MIISVVNRLNESYVLLKGHKYYSISDLEYALAYYFNHEEMITSDRYIFINLGAGRKLQIHFRNQFSLEILD